MMNFVREVMRDAEGEPRIYWHWQNLSEDRDGRMQSRWRYGRAWLHAGTAGVSVEWCVPSSRFKLGLHVSSDAESVVKATACIPPLGLYIGLESWPLCRWLYAWAKRHGMADFDRERRLGGDHWRPAPKASAASASREEASP